MTTQDCADLLNELAGERVYSDRDLRQRVQDGQLECTNPHRGPRERARITTRQFIAYLAKFHPQFVGQAKQRFPHAA